MAKPGGTANVTIISKRFYKIRRYLREVKEKLAASELNMGK
jgi:hypothetical protein